MDRGVGGQKNWVKFIDGKVQELSALERRG